MRQAYAAYATASAAPGVVATSEYARGRASSTLLDTPNSKAYMSIEDHATLTTMNDVVKPKRKRNKKKRRNPNLTHRVYKVAHQGNAAKIDKVAQILPHWQRGMVHAQMLQVRRTIREGKSVGLMDTKGLPNYLSQRQWKSVANQVNSALRSWSSLAAREVWRMISEAELSDEDKVLVGKINNQRAWFAESFEVDNKPVPEPLLSLAAQMVTRVMRTSVPLPNMSRARTMQMDGIVAIRETSKTSTFKYWLRISTLESGKVVRIPLKENPYLDQAPGDMHTAVQVTVSRNGAVTFGLTREKLKAKARTDGAVIGVDWGVKTMVAII